MSIGRARRHDGEEPCEAGRSGRAASSASAICSITCSNASSPTTPPSARYSRAGLASFQLVAEAAPRFVTVTVFGASPTLQVELPFEFVPPADLTGHDPYGR